MQRFAACIIFFFCLFFSSKTSIFKVNCSNVTFSSQYEYNVCHALMRIFVAAAAAHPIGQIVANIWSTTASISIQCKYKILIKYVGKESV